MIIDFQFKSLVGLTTWFNWFKSLWSCGMQGYWAWVFATSYDGITLIVGQPTGGKRPMVLIILNSRML